MDKGTFIKLCSAAMTAHVISPLFTLASDEKLSNWAGNVEYRTQNLYKTTTGAVVNSGVDTSFLPSCSLGGEVQQSRIIAAITRERSDLAVC